MMEACKISIAVIAGGVRSRCVIRHLIQDSQNGIRIVSLYEPDANVARQACDEWGDAARDCVLCKDYQSAIAAPGVDWVMIFSPNAYHKEHILAAFAAQKHVFTEKPLATSIADCQEIFDAHQKSGKLFATGFVLRYSPMYRKAKELLDSGTLGRLLSINANENIPPEHGGYIMSNWRRHTSEAGPHILEKCCHDLDLLNWYCHSLPGEVASFGKRDFFVPENEPLREKYGAKTFFAWEDPHAAESPFTSDKDLMDNQSAIARYRNGVIVTFQCSMSNVIPERRMYFTCSEGSMILDIYTGQLCYQKLGDTRKYTIDFGANGHGGGDEVIMKELFQSMLHNSPVACSGSEGLESAVFALAIDQAATQGCVVSLEKIWQKLHR